MASKFQDTPGKISDDNIVEPGIQTYDEIIGQDNLVARLKEFGEFFTSRGGTPGHILLIGEEGMGKTTIATAFARETGNGLKRVDGAELEILGDLTALLANLKEKQVLVLSNIQQLRRNMVSILRDVMRNCKLTINIGQGASARRHTVCATPFTLLATCPRKADCPPELLGEFTLSLSLEPYSKAALQTIAARIAKKSRISLDAGAADLIAGCCDSRPGHLESILQRLIRAVNGNAITTDDAQQAFRACGISVPRDAPARWVGDLTDLSGIDFEKLIVTLLARMGFQAGVTKASGDGGIDIEATLDKPIVGGRYLFQCKRFAPDNLVGAPTLRDFFGAVTAERAVKGVFITTSNFTVQAREFGQKAGLELINLAQLQRLLAEFGLVNLQAQ
jgi:Holliday junction resolvasome RuvABC ATP-dependent DNA helicase subunit